MQKHAKKKIMLDFNTGFITAGWSSFLVGELPTKMCCGSVLLSKKLEGNLLYDRAVEVSMNRGNGACIGMLCRDGLSVFLISLEASFEKLAFHLFILELIKSMSRVIWRSKAWTRIKWDMSLSVGSGSVSLMSVASFSVLFISVDDCEYSVY